MIKKIIITIFLICFIWVNSFSINNESLMYIGFQQDLNSEFNKIAYYIKKSEELDGNEIFEVIMKYNEIEETLCSYNLNQLDENIISQKITCEVPKKGFGEYMFKGKLSNQENIVKEIINFENILEENSVETKFIDNEDNTLIIIEIKEIGENLILKQEIPKEVIAYLDENNQDSLITTNFEYEILENDPLIAWNIKEAPTKINYTINKKISSEDKQKFQTQLENDDFFNNLKYLILILILFIILLTFKPLIKKNKKHLK